MTGLSWLYGNAEQLVCSDCGERYSKVSADSQGRHGVMDCTVRRFGNTDLFGVRMTWRPVGDPT